MISTLIIRCVIILVNKTRDGSTDEAWGLLDIREAQILGQIERRRVRYSDEFDEEGNPIPLRRHHAAMTTPWPSRSTACTRPSSSVPAVPGGRPTRSNSPPRAGWPGGTPSVSTPPAATSRQPSSRRPIISAYRRPPRPPETQSPGSPRNPGRFTRFEREPGSGTQLLALFVGAHQVAKRPTDGPFVKCHLCRDS